MCQTPASVTDSRNDPGRLRAVLPAEGQGVGQVIIACVIPTRKSGVVWSMCDVVVTAGLRLRLVHFSERLYTASPSCENAAASDVKQAWPQSAVLTTPSLGSHHPSALGPSSLHFTAY